nr:hypothetical protein [Tanacetum cinerariifolium]
KDGDNDEEDEREDSEEGEEDDDDENKDGKSDEHKPNEETREKKSFDPIPQTLKDSEDEDDGEEDLGLNIGKEERRNEEEEEDELNRDVNINQGRGLQGTLEVKDTYVTLTLVKPDGQQESSSVSSQFMTSMLNPALDIILDTYGESVTLKRRRDDDEDKDEEPAVGPDQGSKRRREVKVLESASTPSETATKSAG